MSGKGNTAQCSSGYKAIVFLVCIIAALGGLLFGLDQGFIANSLPTIEKVYHIGITGGESYSAILAVGAAIGALLSGFFARYLGRKRTLVFAGFMFVVMSAISAMLPPFYILSACRFALGFAVGVSSFIVPLYLSETAPSSIRGAMGTLFQLMITAGIFLISLANVIIVKVFVDPTASLPMMFTVIVIFGAIMFIGAMFLPQSPRWLMLKNRKDKALKVLHKTLNTEQEIQLEIKEIEEAIGGSKGSVAGVIFKKYFLKILVVGIFIQIFQMLVGINLMVYYAPTIFGYAGMHGILAKMSIPTVFLVFTFPAIWLVEKWGRKKLLYIGSIIMGITMASAGFAFLAIGNVNDPSLISPVIKGVLLISAVIYTIGFAFTWGPCAWLMCSEIFPIEGREVGMTITTMVNWSLGAVIMGTSLSFMHIFGNYSIFFLFAVCCFLSILFLKLFVPETKGISLEKMEFNLKKGIRLKNIGSY
ncbi:MAG TPA: sugar porter family MFS transporter [Victivallales bacterium]|nr:sugar porter family MFS transporter [Victivallales bacterium]